MSERHDFAVGVLKAFSNFLLIQKLQNAENARLPESSSDEEPERIKCFSGKEHHIHIFQDLTKVPKSKSATVRSTNVGYGFLCDILLFCKSSRRGICFLKVT